MPLRTAFVRFVAGNRALGRLLRALPGGPSFRFDTIQFFEFQVAGFIKVSDSGVAPVLADMGEVQRHRSLRAIQLQGNARLRPSLDVEIRHLLATVEHGNDGVRPGWHY